MELCPSGRRRTLGKRLMVKAIREFESLQLRHLSHQIATLEVAFFVPSRRRYGPGYFCYPLLMEKRNFWLAAIGCSLILLLSTFIFWPLIGHDYALIFPGLIDLKISWSKFQVFNPHFSPMKCLGSPLWANPVSFNLSILHFLTIITNDLIAVVLFIISVSLMSFWGAYRLSLRMRIPHDYALYLACGWTLQGWMILRSSVGHVTYITVGWFPLIVYLLLAQKTFRRDVLSCVLCSVLVSQYVFLAAPYTPFFLIMSGAVLCPMVFLWDKRDLISWKIFLGKIVVTGVATFLIIYPKISAVTDLMSAYPRLNFLENVGFLALSYSVLNLFSFYPHDFKSLTGWWYGNWESVQYIFPLLIISFLIVLLKERRKDSIFRMVLSLLYLLLISFVLTSGVFSEIFKKLPFLNSMHVNPRWNIVLALPTFFLCAALGVTWTKFPRVWKLSLFTLVLCVPFIHLNKESLNINYSYRQGYQEKANRINYCYEPFLGYGLEYFPLRTETGSIHFPQEYMIDPRCYIPSRQCSPGTPLSDVDKLLLESYKLR